MTKTKHKILCVFLSLCMIISCMVGMSVTASSALAPWSGEYTVSNDVTISDVTVSADTTLTIAEGVTVTVNRGINAGSNTLTVAGKGTLVVKVADVNNGEPGNNAITGNIIVNGATVTVTGGYGGYGGDGGNGGSAGNGIKGNLTVISGTATVTGGEGGYGGNGDNGDSGGSGGKGGNGGIGVSGNVTVESGSATVTGGDGSDGGYGGIGGIGGGNDGNGGSKGSAVSGTITGSVQESDDGTAYTDVFGTSSTKQYVKITRPLPSWTNGNVIAILDGTKLTVAKKPAEQSGAMENNGWTAVGTTEWDTIKENITEVEIQDGVTSIGQGAFNKCASLTSVTIPSSVTSIGLGAFNSCTSLTGVTIPSGVTSIGEYAFLNCSALTIVTFEPRSAADIATNSALNIDGDAFTNTADGAKVAYGLGVSSLYYNDTKIEKDSLLTGISSKNLKWKVDNSVKAWTNGDVIGVLEEEGDVKKLIVGKKAGATTEVWGTEWTPLSPNETTWDTDKGSITAVEIQDSVTSIGEGAFDGCTALTSVSIPDSVTIIWLRAFASCSKLASVTIPSSVMIIGSSAFDGCTELTSVTFVPGTADSQLGISSGAFANTATGASLAYGTGDTVLNDGTTEIKAGDLLTTIYSASTKTLTWKAKAVPAPAPVVITKYTITMSNGGKAYVNDKEVTEAEEGATVRIAADEPAYGTEFNGWTTTTEGVVFADADSATTTFTMPAADVEITASYQEIPADPVTPPDTTPFMPTYIPTTPSTPTPTVDITKYKITGKQDETNENALTWDDIPNASAYSLYIMVDGKYVFVQNLGEAINADVVHATNGKYYVSTGKDYTIYEYDSKKGTFTNTGTLEASKIDSIKKANNVTENFMVKYTVDGKESAESNSYKVSVKTYYKPALNITAGKGFIRVTWPEVEGAEAYKAFKVANNRLKAIIETDKHTLRVNGTMAGKEYSYAVKAFVDGKWTDVYKSDVASVTAK